MSKIKPLHILSFFLSIILGLVFIISGFTKLFPIEYFETVIIDNLYVDSIFAGWLARLLIGFEWLIGLLLIFRWKLKENTIPLTFITIIGFCLLLIYQIFSNDNAYNCGCFGNVFIMTPMQALIKNIIMLIILGILLKLSENYNTKRKWIFISLVILSFSMPFILNQGELFFKYPIFIEQEEQINLDLLYTDSINIPQNIDLRKGKHIIAFVSLSCKYCRLASYKLSALHANDTLLPIYLVINGDSADLPEFYKETHAENLNQSMFKGSNKFLSMSGNKLPSIFLVNNSKIQGKFNYRNLNAGDIHSWLKKD